MNKVDRALELSVIDWLQWGDVWDEQKATLALELIAKRKQYCIELEKEIKTLTTCQCSCTVTIGGLHCVKCNKPGRNDV